MTDDALATPLFPLVMCDMVAEASLDGYPSGGESADGEDRVPDTNILKENCPRCDGSKLTKTGKKCEGCNGYGTVFLLRLPTELRNQFGEPRSLFQIWQCNPARYWA